MSTLIPFTDAQIQQMIEMYESGSTVTQVADRYGLSHAATWMRLRKLGVTMRPRGPAIKKRDPEAVARIHALKAQGKTMAQISHTLGISETTIYARLKRA